MASGDITYGTRTALTDVSDLHSKVNGVAESFGEIQAVGEIGINIHLIVPINSSATGGTYDLYVVESQDGTEWTDGIDPSAATSDVVEKISDAKLIKSSDTTYDNSPTGSRTQVQFHVQLSMLNLSEYVGFVLVNNSGQTIPASGADGDSVTYKVS